MIENLSRIRETGKPPVTLNDVLRDFGTEPVQPGVRFYHPESARIQIGGKKDRKFCCPVARVHGATGIDFQRYNYSLSPIKRSIMRKRLMKSR